MYRLYYIVHRIKHVYYTHLRCLLLSTAWYKPLTFIPISIPSVIFLLHTVADIPGLISGAHENRGLGHAFLRHIERCKALLFVVDASSDSPSPDAQLKSLQFELKMYQPELSKRVGLVLANKMDLLTAEEGEREVERLRRESCLTVAPVSALKMATTTQVGHWWTRQRLSKLLFDIAHLSTK